MTLASPLSCPGNSSNARCNLVIGHVVTGMVAIGALSAYGAAFFMNNWVGVVVVAVVAFGSAPDLEKGILAVVLTVFACVLRALAMPSSCYQVLCRVDAALPNCTSYGVVASTARKVTRRQPTNALTGAAGRAAFRIHVGWPPLGYLGQSS